MPRPGILRTVVLGGASSEGTATEPDPPPVPTFSEEELWSVMHLTQPWGVALPGSDSSITEADQGMMVGAYAGNDYSA